MESWSIPGLRGFLLIFLLFTVCRPNVSQGQKGKLVRTFSQARGLKEKKNIGILSIKKPISETSNDFSQSYDSVVQENHDGTGQGMAIELHDHLTVDFETEDTLNGTEIMKEDITIESENNSLDGDWETRDDTKATTAVQPKATPSMAPTERQEEHDSSEGRTEDDTFGPETDDLFDQKSGRDYYKYKAISENTTPSAVTILATLMGLCAMIFTAWQMSDNPDGVFASLCRLIITSLQLLFRVLCSPCRKWCGCSGGIYHESYGHLPVSTMDYGYKDPTIELS